MATAGERLREFMERRYIELKPGRRRHGMQAAIQRETGVKRQTMGKWFSKSAQPDLARLAPIAKMLEVTRAELIAAFDGTALGAERHIAFVSDAERRRRRKWWLAIARQTAGFGLDAARERLAALGVRSERGNLVSLWEDPRNPAEPNEAQLRAMADVYRVPRDRLIELWNNPDPTDEERMAELRGTPLREALAVERPEEPARRRREAS